MTYRLQTPPDTSFRRTLIWSMVLPLILLVLLAGLFLWQIQSLLSAVQQVEHSDAVLGRMYVIEKLIIDQETGLRGYLLTNDETFLEPYTNGETAIEPAFTALATLVADNIEQTTLLKTIQQRYEDWFASAEESRLHKANDPSFIDTEERTLGKAKMDTIRQDISTFIDAETLLRNNRSDLTQRNTRLIIVGSLAATLLLGLVLGGISWRLLTRLAQRHQQALHDVEYQAEQIFIEREWLRNILGSIGDAVIATDVDGQVTFMNAVAENLTGWQEQGAIGHSLTEVFNIVNEETRAKVDNPALRALREGQIVGLANHTILIRHDNSEIPIDDSAAPVRNTSQEVIGAVLVFRDISATKEAEQALLASERRAQALAETIPLSIWATSTNGELYYTNPFWTTETGITIDEQHRPHWTDIVIAEDRATTVQRWEEALRTDKAFEIEHRWRSPKGGERWHLVRSTPVRDHQGATEFWIAAGTDIDDRRRIETTLRKQTEILSRITRNLEDRNRDLDQFAYAASHDLKAPLRGIANLSQWIEEDLGDDLSEDVRKNMDRLRDRVHRMEALINDILAYSRAGRAQGSAELVDVNAMLESTVDLLAPPPGMQIQIAPQLPKVMAERSPFQQVFQNLISNAIKHHDSSEGLIEISAEDQGNYVLFRVRDDGPGIAAEYHDRIFQMFQTLAPRDKVEGSGMGLALVKKIVERYNGQITLESSEGKGSTFMFTWPKHLQEDV